MAVVFSKIFVADMLPRKRAAEGKAKLDQGIVIKEGDADKSPCDG